jgi:hypothetical protein
MWNEGEVEQYLKIIFHRYIKLKLKLYADSTLQYPLTYRDKFCIYFSIFMLALYDCIPTAEVLGLCLFARRQL